MAHTSTVAREHIIHDRCYAKSVTKPSPSHISWEDANKMQRKEFIDTTTRLNSYTTFWKLIMVTDGQSST
jgi:hypothetical protein